ncbi:UNVERIFIED_ORG: hypothetical protein B5F06_07645 [Lacrimispora saccharolytica]|nr:hypothetical protein CLOM621_07240 [Clostridium sp. M62/1]CBL36640.1 hypothetical protein CL3_24810 [butyrate-producing bacterium SM4/1]
MAVFSVSDLTGTDGSDAFCKVLLFWLRIYLRLYVSLDSLSRKCRIVERKTKCGHQEISMVPNTKSQDIRKTDSE